VESEEHWRHKGVQYLNTHSFGDIDDELDVRVVVVIGSAGNRHVWSAIFDILWRLPSGLRGSPESRGRHEKSGRTGDKTEYHNNESDGSFVSEDLVTPSPYRAHAFDGCDAIVGDQYFVDDFGSVEPLNELFRCG